MPVYGTVEKEDVDASADMACCKAVTNIERAMYAREKQKKESTKDVIYGYRRTGTPEAHSECSGWAHPTLVPGGRITGSS